MKISGFYILFFILFLPICFVLAGIEGSPIDSTKNEPFQGTKSFLLNAGFEVGLDLGSGYDIFEIPAGRYSIESQKMRGNYANSLEILINKNIPGSQNLTWVSINKDSSEGIVAGVEPQLIHLNETDSYRIITADDLQNMPVATVEEAVGYTAGGVTDAEGNLHLRGGNYDEVVYLYDGIQLNDPITGNPNNLNIPIFGVNKINVMSGIFGTEFGRAQSGIINVTGRDGTNTLKGDFRLSNSNGISDYLIGEDPHNRNKIEFFVSGPVIKNIAFFSIAGEINKNNGRMENQFSDLQNYSGRFSWKITDNLKINFSGLYYHSNFEDGFSLYWSHTLSEDKLTEYIPQYLRIYDGAVGETSDGIMQDDEIPDFYGNWLVSDGLQTEDADGDGILDLFFTTEPYADWNGNGQWDYGEWFRDLDGDHNYDLSLEYEEDHDRNGQVIAPDGDQSHEDFNNDFMLDSEQPLDAWYGNGRLDTEDLNGDGILNDGINAPFLNEALDGVDYNRDGDMEDILNEDLNGNGLLETEDVDRNGRLTTYRMFDRLPLWRKKSYLWNIGLTHKLSERTYYTIRVAEFSNELQSNIIERLNEDTDNDGQLDVYWITEPFEDIDGNDTWNDGEWFADLNNNGVYDVNLDWDVDGDGDKRNEDLNGNGILDIYAPEQPITGFDDPRDMFHDKNNNNYVDESERDWDGDGEITYYDRNYFWLKLNAIPDEGSKHYGNFYGVSPTHPYTYSPYHRSYEKKVTRTYKFDLVSQFNNRHEFSAGFEYLDHNLSNYLAKDRSGYSENYTVIPNELSFYASARMEYRRVVVNAGLRMDYFMPNTEYPLKWDDPTWTSGDYDDWDGDGEPEYFEEWKAASGLYVHQLRDIKNPRTADNELLFSPRLGISGLITNHTMLYFNYGHYYPSLIAWNVNARLEPTVSYEFGIRQQVSRLFMIEARGFLNEGNDQQALTKRGVTFDRYSPYFRFNSNNVRGIELVITRRVPKLIYGELNYTYSEAKGKTTVHSGYLEEWSGTIIPNAESYLKWDQTHTFNANINLSYLGFLSTLTINYGSGTRYTKPNQGRIVIENTEKFPWFMTSNLRLSYNMKIGSYQTGLFLYVTNLFNFQRFRKVVDTNWYHNYKTVKEDYDKGKITLNEYMAQVDLDHDGKVDLNKKYPERGPYMNPAIYQDKRRFQIGITVGF